MPQKQSRALFEKNPVFRNFISASTISLLGSYIFDFTIPVYIASRTQSITALALSTICLHLPFIVMAPLVGFVVDNFNKRRVMLFSDIGQVTCMIFLILYEAMGIDSLWPLFAAVFIAKTLMILFETVATFQLIPSLVTHQELGEANTWFLSAQRLIQILGPLLAGALFSAVGFSSCIAFNLLSFGATLYFVLSIKNLNELIYKAGAFKEGIPFTPGNVFRHFKDCTTYIWASPLFRPFVLMMFVWNLSSLVPGTPTIIHYFMVDNHFDPVQYALVVAFTNLMGIVGFIAATSIYRKHRFYKSFVGSGKWTVWFSTLSVIFLKYPLMAALFLAISKAGSSVLSMGTFVLRQMNIPSEKMGGVNASLRMFFMSSAPLSSALQGLIILHSGVEGALAMGALSLWVTLWYAKKVAEAYERSPLKWEAPAAA
jgi:MFS family permease